MFKQGKLAHGKSVKTSGCSSNVQRIAHLSLLLSAAERNYDDYETLFDSVDSYGRSDRYFRSAFFFFIVQLKLNGFLPMDRDNSLLSQSNFVVILKVCCDLPCLQRVLLFQYVQL